MLKTCSCGETMRMKLRTVIYSSKVEIDNVPVYTCKACSRSEVYTVVKTDLTGLIGKLGAQPEKQTFRFDDWNEWANLLVEAFDVHKKQPDPALIDRLAGERIDMLLDLYSLAEKIGDNEWKNDISKRLTQLSHTASIHRSAIAP
ncbi:hypothetical protein H8B09_05000 [Paenibacillus sp. PR3]|uniref:YgiT-type zinc finger protein n=1 Tax=Paenibacillus terricola TaxID=2763503 RepID=A0ABR8MR61_9BACL|nr:hypothetical protein [Paenibacillus terricola]MBD3918100.1 hypothetical protein [Paenibacillus terricola]